MPIYEYRGLNKSGKNIRGTIDADNVRLAKSKLKKEGTFVVDIKDKQRASKKGKKKSGHSKKVSVDDISSMTRQLATLLSANVPLVDSLGAVSEQVDNPILREAVSDLKNMVNEGAPLHKSMEKYPKLFDRIYLSMVEAGEMSGTLDVILIRLAEFKESQAELAAKIKSAMIYPVVMFLFTMLMLVVMFVFVIPKMLVIFESAPDLVLPWYTLMVIDFSDLLTNDWPLLIIGIGSVAMLFRFWKNTPKGGAQWDAILLKLPVVGELARVVAISRFTRTLSTLLTGGVPMLAAMDIVSNVVDNSVLEKSIITARDNISEGESIAGPLKKSGEFPPIVTHMISIGEKTGELENMLTQVSDSYDFQVKTQVDGLTATIEPVMIIVMGLVIAAIVFSIMIPMFEMTNLG